MTRKRFKGLFRLKGKVNPVKIFGFDTETYDNNSKMVLCSIVGDNYTKVFDNKMDFIKEITSNRCFRNSYICATNLLFDLFAIFTMEEVFSFFNTIERQGNLILAKAYVKYDKNDHGLYTKERVPKGEAGSKYYKITFIDSGNHLKKSVKALGKIVGLPKLPQPSFLGEYPKNSEEYQELVKYNIRDSEITYRFMKFLQESYNKLGCNMKITSSSTSKDLFQRKFMKSGWFQEDRDIIINSYKSFYGGRTETFKRGIFLSDNYNNIKSYDVNSLYPYCLRNRSYPYPDSYTRDKVTVDDIDSFEGFCKATLLTPKDGLNNVPIIPAKTDKLLFPEGTVSGYYDFHSLRTAINEGYEIQSLKEGIIYENTFKPFKHFIDALYKKRLEFIKEGNPTELAIKIAMNSFYGKFGYNYIDKEILCDGNSLLKTDPNATIYPTKDNNIYRVVTSDDSYIPGYVFPVFSIYTTSYAREYMYNKFYKKLGDDHLFYTDTDCVFTDKKLATSEGLGKLKLENEFEELCLVKPKFYSGKTVDDKNLVKVKGVHGSIKDYDTFKQLILSNNFEVETRHFRKLRSSIGDNNKYVNEIYQQIKHLGLDDDKRVWEKERFTQEVQSSTPIIL